MNKFKLLCEIGDLNTHPVKQVNTTYTLRKASRAVLKDNNNIALLHVKNYKYYKLPGGGIEKGETTESALNRELLEETGCNAQIKSKIGIVIEYRKSLDYETGLIQISYCYDALVVKKVSKPNFTQSENSDGMELIWVPIKKAINLLKNSNQIDEMDYMVKRDLQILKNSSFNK